MPSGYTPLFCACAFPARISPQASPNNGRMNNPAPRFLIVSSRLRLKIREPLQYAQSRHEAVFAAARDYEVRDALKASSHWLARQREIDVARANDWIFVISGAKKDSIVYPLRLHKLKLPSKVCSNKSKHQTSVGAIVVENAFGE